MFKIERLKPKFINLVFVFISVLILVSCGKQGVLNDGKKSRLIKLKDPAPAPTESSTTTPIDPFATCSISFENGDYTNQLINNVLISCSNVVEMQKYNNSDCSGEVTWESFESIFSVTLTSTNNLNSFSTKLKKSNGSISSCLTANIIHDDINPDPPSSLVLGSIPQNLNETPTITYLLGNDNESGLAGHQVQIEDTGSNVIVPFTEHQTGNEISGLSLTDNQSYNVFVKAVDNAGNESSVISSNWTATNGCSPDITNPTDPTNLSLSGSPTNATSSILTYNASSDACGLSHYELAIGTTEGGTDKLDWTNIDLVTSYQATGLSLLFGTDYYTSLKAIDDAGNESNVITSSSWQVSGTLSVTGIANDTTSKKTKTWVWSCDGDGCTYRHIINTSSTHAFSAEPYGATTTDSQLTGDNTFYLHVQAKDSYGNESAILSVSAIIDNTSPTDPSSLTYSSYTNLSSSSPTANWSNSSDSNGVNHYEVALGTTIGGHEVVNWESNLLNLNKIFTSLSLVGATNYYISVKAIDEAGNESNVITGPVFLYDGNSPNVTSVDAPSPGNYTDTNTMDITVYFDENVVIENIPRIQLNFSSGSVYADYLSGSGSSIITFRYTVVESDFDNNGITITSPINLNTSGTIKDNAGNNSNLTFTPPDGSAITVNVFPVNVTGLSNDLVPTQSKAWSWVCDATNCTYRYVINTTSSHTFTSEPYDSTTMDSQSTGDGTYYIHVQAKDDYGNESSVTSVSALLDNSAPTTPGSLAYDDWTILSVSAPEATWTASTDTNGIDHYEVTLGTSAGGSEVVPWVDNNLVLSKTFSGLSLIESTNYYISVRAHDQAGNTSAVATGSAFQLDETAPSILSFNLPANGNYTTTNNLDFILNFNENVTITNSPQLEITLTSGTVYADYFSGSGTANITFRYTVTAPNVDSNGIELVSPLDLNISGTIKDDASNNAALNFTPPDTSGITVNAVVVLVTGLSNDTNPSQAKTWTWGCDAGTCTYRYVINTSPTHSFTTEPYDTTTTDSQLSGSNTYYIHVQAKDQFENTSAVTSVSTVLDNTSPTIPGALSYSTLHADSTTSPNSTWNASNDTNGVDHYEVALGTTVGGSEIVSWTDNALTLSKTFSDLSLSEATNYYISVRAHDQAGNISFVRTGSAFIVDESAPTITSFTLPSNGDYTTSQIVDFVVHFDETVFITNTPQLQINLTSGTINANFFSGNGSSNITFRYSINGSDVDSNGVELISPLDLNISGSIKDQAGNDAQLTFTPPDTSGITFNLVTVNVTGLSNDLNPTQSKTWSWGCDAGSCTYRYAINTSATHTFTTEPYGVTTTDSQSAGDGTYYIHVQAKDDSENESVVTSVNALIDNTSPTTPGSLTNSILTNDSTSSPNATWSASTDTNGVDRYEVALGTTAGGSDIVTWTDNALTLSKIFTGLSLSESTNYYISSRAHDEAGNVSTLATGPAFQLDETTPSISSVVAPGNGDYVTSETLDFTVNFDENVTITNSPRLEISFDSGTVYADYLSGSGSSAIIFRYSVGSSDNDADGITLTSPLDLNISGTIQDDAGNNSNLTFTAPDTSGITINHGSLDWDPTFHDYGSPGNDTTHTFTLTNNTGATTGTLNIGLTGAQGKFVITADNCDGTTLLNGESCTVDVKYKWKNPSGLDECTLDADDGTYANSSNLQGFKN
ncbi:hypothetical protein N9N67_00265 [Bacteriovoracaceae bacterium]|nr:hypothetical protein [Bacteriovoracaceae bacterium]